MAELPLFSGDVFPCKVFQELHPRKRLGLEQCGALERRPILSVRYFFSLAGPPMNSLYFASSAGEHIISVTSKCADCDLNGSLFKAIQGLVYILGSMIVTVSSK